MTIGQRIKTVREQSNMTQEDLGKACKTTKQTIFKYEAGIITNIPMDRLCDIAKALDVSPSFLMGWDGQDLQSNLSGGYDISPLVEPDLTTSERKLIVEYRLLNEEGQERLHEYASDLIASGRYKKDNPTQLDKEA